MSSENKDYPNEIAADVLRVLSEMNFFELLDVQLCPLDNSLNPAQCTHTFDRSVEILRANKLIADDVADVLAVLRSKGACCDCEVLYNVVEESRLKARYWQGKSGRRH